MLSFPSFYVVSDNISMKILVIGIDTVVSPVAHRCFEKYQKISKNILLFKEPFLVKWQVIDRQHRALMDWMCTNPKKPNGTK